MDIEDGKNAAPTGSHGAGRDRDVQEESVPEGIDLQVVWQEGQVDVVPAERIQQGCGGVQAGRQGVPVLGNHHNAPLQQQGLRNSSFSDVGQVVMPQGDAHI